MGVEITWYDQFLTASDQSSTLVADWHFTVTISWLTKNSGIIHDPGSIERVSKAEAEA